MLTKTTFSMPWGAGEFRLGGYFSRAADSSSVPRHRNFNVNSQDSVLRFDTFQHAGSGYFDRRSCLKFEPSLRVP